MVDAVFIVID